MGYLSDDFCSLPVVYRRDLNKSRSRSGTARDRRFLSERDRFGFAYGTLPGHPERGEEAFVVEREAERVTFSIVAFSRPAELLAHLGGPVTRRIQRNTTSRYLDGLAAFVASAN